MHADGRTLSRETTIPSDLTAVRQLQVEIESALQKASIFDEREIFAVKLAVETSLVTPVSGAVVLETQQQYDENRLTPVSEARVPTLPEPHEWALIGLAGLIACWLLGRGDRIPRRGMPGTGAA